MMIHADIDILLLPLLTPLIIADIDDITLLMPLLLRCHC
jgi:hypothetical protein